MSNEGSNKKIPTSGDFEALFVNNIALTEIEYHLNKFNPIRIMKMENMEIRHSAILGWLLDPSETHGLHDEFLKAFLAEALKDHSIADDQLEPDGPNALNVIGANLKDAQVRLEWKNIDILIECPTQSWVFVIENKFHSTQGNGQLKKYLNVVNPSPKKKGSVQGIFLTLWNEAPDEDSYATIKYEDICNLIEPIVKFNEAGLSQEVLIFIRHYIDILKEKNDMDEENERFKTIAKRLYREHKKVLDFVIEHGASTDFALAARTFFIEVADSDNLVEADGKNYHYGSLSTSRVSFLPIDWLTKFGQDATWEGCENWWLGYPLILWFQLKQNQDDNKGNLFLVGEVGPLSNHNLRTNLLDIIDLASDGANDEKIGYRKSARNSGSKYTKFFKNNSIVIDDVSDSESIKKSMTELLSNFDAVIAEIGEKLKSFENQV